MRLGRIFEAHKNKGAFWFRIFGYGLAFDNQLRFSQRYGHTKYYKFFGKIVTPLRPYKRWVNKYQTKTKMSKEEIYEQAYNIYITEGRAEANRLTKSGCLVNYREWRKEQFFEICDDNTHWAHKELIEFVKRVKSKQR